MKKNLFVFAMLMMSVMAFAKDVKTVVFTTQPQMHCSSCEDKIKSNLRFEKGIKTIETSVENQTVTVTYDADKTTAENLQKGFEKFGYTASVVDNAAPADTTKVKKSCCCGKKAEGATAAAGGCCGGRRQKVLPQVAAAQRRQRAQRRSLAAVAKRLKARLPLLAAVARRQKVLPQVAAARRRQRAQRRSLAVVARRLRPLRVAAAQRKPKVLPQVAAAQRKPMLLPQARRSLAAVDLRRLRKRSN